jgi:hypothetical protein
MPGDPLRLSRIAPDDHGRAVFVDCNGVARACRRQRVSAGASRRLRTQQRESTQFTIPTQFTIAPYDFHLRIRGHNGEVSLVAGDAVGCDRRVQEYFDLIKLRIVGGVDRDGRLCALIRFADSSQHSDRIVLRCCARFCANGKTRRGLAIVTKPCGASIDPVAII